jgi:hypothetical protein
MNTLRAFQGIATAFNVTLAPDTVDFFLAPDLVGEIHRGDGNVALATVTPTWINTDNDALAVPLPAATSAALEAGHYFLTVKAADGTATLSHDTLVIYPTPDGDVPIRSLVTPSEMIGVIPEITPDLGQLDALPWLLEAATVACESYLGRALYPTTIDAVDYSFLTDSGTIHLGQWPITALRVQVNEVAGLTITSPAGVARGMVTVAPMSDTDASIKTLTLKSTGSADTVLTLADYATIADLAAAVVLAGWTASASYGTRPTSDLVAISGPCTIGARSGAELHLFEDDLDGYVVRAHGTLDVTNVPWGEYRIGRHGWACGPVRLTYTAGYALPPKDLRTAVIMMALHMREAAKTAGPVQQQGVRDRYYTLAPTLDIPAPVKAILDRYADNWGVV